MTDQAIRATLTIRKNLKGLRSYGVYVRATKKVLWCKDRETAMARLKKLNAVKAVTLDKPHS